MGRKYCKRCNKPESVCLCAYLLKQQNDFPVYIFQHSDEAKKPLSSVPLVSAGLTQVKVYSGLAFERNICSHKPILLYPSFSHSSSEQVILDLKLAESNKSYNLLNAYDSLIVLDGTWRNTRELVLKNPWLTGLPTLSLRNVGQSRYRIRKSNHQESLSTIEAVSAVLAAIDMKFDTKAFLKPFEKMIDQQIQYMGEDVYRRNYC